LFLSKYNCANIVLISTKILIPENFNPMRFKIFPKENLQGIVCFGNIKAEPYSCYPFSGLDMDIDDFISVHETIEEYRKKSKMEVYRNPFNESDDRFSVFDKFNKPGHSLLT
jgi:hypothetical protein